MPGINLSQSIQEKQEQARVKFFDQGLVLTVGGFMVLLIAFGGVRWYSSSLDKQLEEKRTTITQTTAQLKGPNVNRIVDFSFRLKVIEAALKYEEDPTVLLRSLEQTVLPTVRLTEFQYAFFENQEQPKITVQGITKTLKEVAQQMVAFKKMNKVEQVTVENIEYNDDDTIDFTLELEQAKVDIDPIIIFR